MLTLLDKFTRDATIILQTPTSIASTTAYSKTKVNPKLLSNVKLFRELDTLLKLHYFEPMFEDQYFAQTHPFTMYDILDSCDTALEFVQNDNVLNPKNTTVKIGNFSFAQTTSVAPGATLIYGKHSNPLNFLRIYLEEK